MARISTYNLDGAINDGDKLIGTDADQENATKNFTLSGIAEFAIDKLIDPAATDFHIPVFNQNGTRITDSIIYQDSVAGTAITVSGNLSVTDDAEIDSNLTVEGVSYLQGHVYTNSNVDLGDTALDTIKQNGTLELLGPVKDSTGVIGNTEQVLVSNAQGKLVWENYQGSGLEYQAAWNASTNVPDLTAIALDDSNTGKYWVVSTAGNTDLGGITDWNPGDWAIVSQDSAGTVFWDHIDGSSVDGAGVTDKLAVWTSEKTLGTAPITIISGNALFGGDILLEENQSVYFDVSGTVYADDYLNLESGGSSIFVDGADDSLLFKTESSTAVTIDGQQNVGIGTTSPGAKLDVAGNINVTGNLTTQGVLAKYGIFAINSSAWASVVATSTINNGGGIRFGTNTYAGSNAGTDFAVRIGGNGSFYNKFTVDSTGAGTFGGTIAVQGTGNSYFQGNVGIGTTTPSAKLQVIGDARISRDVIVGNDISANNIDAGDDINAGLDINAQYNITAGAAITAGGSISAGADITGSNFYVSNSIVHRDDFNTSIQFPQPDTIRLTAGGNEKIFIEPSGISLRDSATITGSGNNNTLTIAPTANYAQINSNTSIRFGVGGDNKFTIQDNGVIRINSIGVSAATANLVCPGSFQVGNSMSNSPANQTGLTAADAGTMTYHEGANRSRLFMVMKTGTNPDVYEQVVIKDNVYN